MLKDALRHSLRRLTESDEPPVWLDGIAVEDRGDAIHVVFPHAYFDAYFAPHRDHFEQALRQTLARPLLRIRYDVFLSGRRLPRSAVPAPAEALPAAGRGLDFASFLYNEKNAVAVAAMRSLRHDDTPGLLVLYGESGAGKSHLLRALHGELHAGGRRVAAYSLARPGTIRFPWEESPEAFWQGCDTLLLDDLHTVMDSEQRCRALIACMDVADQTDKRLVLAFTGSQRRLQTAPSVLRTRLEAGMLIELFLPDVDVRLRYAQRHCRECGLSLSSTAMMRMARSCRHIRRMRGLLRHLRTLAILKNEQPQAERDLDDLLRATESGAQDHTAIMETVARRYGLHAGDLLSGGRHPRLVLARQIAMYVCRRHLGLSYPELGRAFGGKDHSTVIHAVKKIEKMLVNDKSLHQFVASVTAKAEK